MQIWKKHCFLVVRVIVAQTTLYKCYKIRFKPEIFPKKCISSFQSPNKKHTHSGVDNYLYYTIPKTTTHYIWSSGLLIMLN